MMPPLQGTGGIGAIEGMRGPGGAGSTIFRGIHCKSLKSKNITSKSCNKITCAKKIDVDGAHPWRQRRGRSDLALRGTGDEVQMK